MVGLQAETASDRRPTKLPRLNHDESFQPNGRISRVSAMREDWHGMCGSRGGRERKEDSVDPTVDCIAQESRGHRFGWRTARDHSLP